MFKRAILALTAVFIIVNAVYGDIKLYLKPKVTIENGSLILRDIALIEGNYPDLSKISNIKIESDLYSDGYIDKKEILSLLSKYTRENIYIYGNAVRVTDGENINAGLNQSNDFLVKKGVLVNVVVILKGVSLMVRGTVLEEGRLEDEVSVRLENKNAQNKLIRGRIKGKDLIEVKL